MSFWCLQFPPKNERKQVDLRFHSSKVEFICSFFGGNLYLKKSFRFFLTFSYRENHRIWYCCNQTRITIERRWSTSGYMTTAGGIWLPIWRICQSHNYKSILEVIHSWNLPSHQNWLDFINKGPNFYGLIIKWNNCRNQKINWNPNVTWNKLLSCDFYYSKFQ